MNKPLFDAYFRFKIEWTEDEFYGKLIPIQRIGSNKVFDTFFQYHQSVNIHCDGDPDRGTLYYFFSCKSPHEEINLAIYTDSTLMPFGKDCTDFENRTSDCFLVKAFDDGSYEVFVSEGNGHRSVELFDMFAHYALEGQINLIKERCSRDKFKGLQICIAYDANEQSGGSDE